MSSNALETITGPALVNALQACAAQPAPSLASLRAQLDRAESDLFRADYCESTARATAEANDARRRIESLTAQIARIEETF